MRGNLCNCRPIPLACLNFAAAFKDIGRNLERDGDYMQKLLIIASKHTMRIQNQ